MTQETTTEAATETIQSGQATSEPAAAPATAAEATIQQQPAEQEAAPEAETKTEGAPEAYEFKAPEGREFNPEVLAQFAEVSKELNLTQESAQKMLDKIAPAIASRQEAAMAEARAEARAQWVASTKADSEIGGDALAENVGIANKAFKDYGTPELRKLLDESGLGEHPELIRWAYRVGKATSEDGFVAGRGSNTPTDPAKVLFPNMN